MYKHYFGIDEKPFSITPDPRYLLLTQGHEEALAHLLYGIGNGGGFVLLTGEVGTGKTSVCRRLLELVDDTVHCALVLNPHLNELDLAAVICDELGVHYPTVTKSLKMLVDLLNQHLLALHARGGRAVVLIDEAQNLSPSVLEELRLLTNLETEKQKLLQIILVGQPELNDLLRRRDLRQVAQRITARYHLMPLKGAETQAYIAHRLQVAGVPPSLFSRRSVSLIHKLSGGVPRLINLICDRAMLGAYVQERRAIDRALARRAARQVFGPGGPQPAPDRSGRRRRVAALGAFAMVLAVASPWFAKGPWIDQWLRQEKTWALLVPSLDAVDSQPAPAGDAVAAAASTETIPTETAPGEAVPAEAMRGEATQDEPAVGASGAGERPSAVPEAVALLAPEPVAPVLVSPARPGDDDDDAPTGADQAAPPEVTTDLAGTLRNATAPGSRETARRRLFALWASDEPPTDGAAACDPARNGGFSCLRGNDGWRGLETFGRPALITLRGPDGELLSAALLSLDGDRVTLEITGEELVAPRQDVTALWTGDYLLLWRAPESSERLLAQDSRGTDVLWLRQALAAVLGHAAGPPDSPLFDVALKEAVVAFQRSRSLAPDGIVGPKTVILLNNALGGDAIPRLRAE